MLPLQIHQGVRARSLSRSYSIALTSSPPRIAVITAVTVPTSRSQRPRTCFGWHRRYERDDARIQRLRQKLLKAKLLQSLKFNVPNSRAVGWRLSSSWGQPKQPNDPDNQAPDASKKGNGQPEENFPYELSEREKRWQQRMDDMKKWIDQDPYEAMFGWSNRLRRGERPAYWPFVNVATWLREETDALKEALKEPSSRYNHAEAEAKSQRADSNDASLPEKVTEVRPPSHGSPPATTPNLGTEMETPSPSTAASETTETSSTRRIFIRRSIDDPPLEYDPISNRMIRKGDKAFSHYAQELYLGEQTDKSGAPQTFRRKVPIQVVEELPKPSMTTGDSKDSSKGSLTPYKTPNSSNARAEYEAYKAERLKAVEDFNKSVEEAKEGLDALNKEFPLYKPAQQKDAEKEEYRQKLHTDFERIHSEPDIAERDLPSLTPYKMQRSRGTTIQPRADAMAAESGSEAPQLHPNFKPVHNHREVLLMQLDDIDNQDRRVQAQIAKMERTIDPSDKDIDVLETKLEGLWMKRQGLEQQRAEVNRQLRDLRWSEKSSDRLAGSSDSLKSQHISDYSPAVPSGYRRARVASGEERMAPISGHPYPQVSANSISTPTLETALDRYKSVDVDVTKGLQTALQRRSKEPIALLEPEQRPQQPALPTPDANTRQHVPYGYDHGRESAKFGRLNRSPTAAPQAERSTSFSEPKESAPSDAGSSKPETVIQRLYRTDIIDKLKNLVHRISEPGEPKQSSAEELRKQKQEQAAKNLLEEEVEQQKLAMQKMENRRLSPATESVEPVALPDPDSIQKRAAEEVAKKEQKAKDAELVREIRNIYEREYGLITTKHRQVKETSQEAVQEEMLAQTAKKPNEGPLSAFSLAIAPKEPAAASIHHPISSTAGTQAAAPVTGASTSTSEIKVENRPVSAVKSSAPTQTEPSSSVSDVPKAETTSFVILAYDHTTSSVTRATVSAPPGSTDTPMPLTVALAQLTHPAKFLPHLQSLKHQGFVPVSCSSSLLILRRMGPAVVSAEQTENPRGTKSIEELVNPVDKTAAPGLAAHHVPTGDFASPTGFVNYNLPDEVEPAMSQYQETQKTNHAAQQRNGQEWAWGYRRKPKRVERVFSGGGHGGNAGHGSGKPFKNWKWEQRKERRRRLKRMLKNAAAAFGLAVAVMYVAGVVTEMRREMKKVTITIRPTSEDGKKRQ